MVSNFIARATEAAVATTLRARRKFAVVLAAALCAVAAVGFLTTALFMALANEIGDIGAALCMAGVYAFAAAAIAYLGNHHADRAHSLYEARPPSDTEILAGLITAFMTGYRATKGSGGQRRD